jgi:cyclopropane-fatty-acyl-phospholipid synthase
MASRQQIEDTYNYMDELFQLEFGTSADCSCAMYDQDFSKSLDEAQTAKHEYILASLNVGPGMRVLDIGCGWGPMLAAIKNRGAHGIGLTLSGKQAEACIRNGLEAHIKDWKDIGPQTFGNFESIISIGSFEHFCSKEEFSEGRQEEIYKRFFALCDQLLPLGGRLYLQTMLWGRNVPCPDDISLLAKRGSNEYIVGVAEKFYPGSWLPRSAEQIIGCAEPLFKVIAMKNGRLDYIRTMTEWNCRIWRFSWVKLVAAFKTLRYLYSDQDFVLRLELLRRSYNRECFIREIMDHERIVFEKRAN